MNKIKSQNDSLKDALDFPLPVKRREPKFVPYEPYKAAITPIVPPVKKDKHSRKKYQNGQRKTDIKLAEACIPFPLIHPVNSSPPIQIIAQTSPVIRILREVEVPIKSEEEKDEKGWEEEKQRLEEKLQKVQNEKKEIEEQFKVQLKVNAELKKLLVASLGEDLQTRIQFLSEDKAKLAEDIMHYSKMLQEEHEEMDRLSIQCDVWRSKFLACSLMVDELAQWKAHLSHHFEESCEAIQWLLEERSEMYRCMQSLQKCLKLLQDTFDPLSQKSKKHFKSPNMLQLCRENKETAESLGKCLLGAKSWEAFLTRTAKEDLSSSDNFVRTPAEEFAQRICLMKTLQTACVDATSIADTNLNFKAGMPLRYCRLHSHNELSTIGCCRQCSGEVKVL